MSKKFFTFIFATLLVAAMSLTSCKKSNQDLIDEYRDVTTELLQAMHDNDQDKVADLSKKADKLTKELGDRELTATEKQEIVAITMDLYNGAALLNTEESNFNQMMNELNLNGAIDEMGLQGVIDEANFESSVTEMSSNVENAANEMSGKIEDAANEMSGKIEDAANEMSSKIEDALDF